jgi:hypothetical protein
MPLSWLKAKLNPVHPLNAPAESQKRSLWHATMPDLIREFYFPLLDLSAERAKETKLGKEII